MSEEYTVPALRDQADRMRKQAEEVLAGAQAEAQRIVSGGQAEAEKLRAAAAEIDELADRQMSAEPKPPVTFASCVNCGNPIVKDELGWRHPPENAGLCTDPVPPQVPAVTRTDGEVAQ
jgi:hypothetical protein